MHIGYVLTTFPALSETFVFNEILELERQGLTITVLALRRPREEPRHSELLQLRARIIYLTEDPSAQPSVSDLAKGVVAYVKTILHGEFSELRNIGRGTRVAAAARRCGVNALHAHFADRPASLAFWAHRLTGLPFSFTAHAIDIFDHGLRDKLMVTKLREARFVITVSEFNKAFIVDHYPGANAETIHVINNSVDLKYFAFRESEPSGDPSILSVGRLVPKKGFDLLIRVCAKLRDGGQCVRFTIIGDGPERERLGELAKSLEVSQLITFSGAMSHDAMRGLLQEATILCMAFRRTPSGDQDAMPLVLIEAMATGVPVISTRLAAVPEMVDDGVNGLLVDPEDVDGLAAAIETMLKSADLRARLAHSAREKAERYFSLPTNVGKVRGLMLSS